VTPGVCSIIRSATSSVGSPSSAAQDAQDVELLRGDAVRLDQRRRLPADQVRRAHQADDRFVGGRLERPALAEFVLQRGRHGSYITRQ
jgi:hypothetical protein